MEWSKFQKPQRYVGNEWNVVRKTHRGRVRVCMCFPDLYEVGMSNLGLRIIYGLLNGYEKVVCERAFMPGPDLEQYLRGSGTKLCSLETKTALDEFDVIAVNLGCELNYTNFLAMLSLSGLPLDALKREKCIVMGGGIANPEPIASFVDVFYLGEFEARAEEFVRVMSSCRDKEERLQAFAQMEGFYVPRFYEPRETADGYACEKSYSPALLPLTRVYVRDLNTSYYPLKWIVPHTQIVHDRAQVEIARGCPNRCAFCQARCVYYPYREKNIDVVCRQMEELYEKTGYEEFSFLSLSASNYSHIEPLLDRAVDFLRGKGAGLSLPSLRVDDVVGRLHQKLRSLRKTSLTVALEAGTPRMRDAVRKDIDVNALIEAKDLLRSLSLRHIKLYFMFGFPGESDDDVAAIGELVHRLRRELGVRLHVSINAFIPKPFSFFEHEAMEEEAVLERKRGLILRGLRHKQINVSLSDIKRSMLEAVLSRGDRALSPVIRRVFLKGGLFDSYGDFFNWALWEEAFSEEDVDYRRYLYRRREKECWAHLEGQCSNIR